MSGVVAPPGRLHESQLSPAFRDGALVVSRRMGGPNKRATQEVAQVKEPKSKNGDKVDVSASDAAPADLSGLRGIEPFFGDADHTRPGRRRPFREAPFRTQGS